jgi:hypothetical protein
MAHYIAELISRVETAAPADRPPLEQKCAHEIERLWAHRTHFPSRRPPMSSFEPLYRTLERLSPDNPEWSFYSHFDDDNHPDREETLANNLLRAASELETTARDVVRTFIVEAAAIAEQRESKWIEAAEHLKDEESGYLSIIRRMQPRRPSAELTEEAIEKALEEEDSPTDATIQALDEMINICTQAKATLQEGKT